MTLTLEPGSKMSLFRVQVQFNDFISKVVQSFPFVCCFDFAVKTLYMLDDKLFYLLKMSMTGDAFINTVRKKTWFLT